MKSPYIISLAIRVVSAVLAVLQTFVLARVLGASSLGLYSTLLAVITLLAIPISAGLPTLLTREIAQARIRGETEKIRPLVTAGSQLALLSTIGTTGILILLRITEVIPVSWVQVAILVLAVPLLGMDLLRGGAMRGLGSAIGSQVPESLIRPLGFLIFIGVFLLASSPLSVTEALIAFALAGLLSWIVGQVLLNRTLPQKLLASERLNWGQLFKQSTGLALLAGTSTMIGNLDLLVLSILGSYSDVGAYKVAFQGVVLILLIHNAINAVAQRDLASTIAGGDTAAAIPFVDRSTIWASFGTIAAWAGAVTFGSPIIQAVFGSSFEQAFAIVVILGAGHVLAAATGPVFEILVMTKRHLTAIVANLLSIVVLIVISFVLSPYSPVLGVALGSSIANIMRNVIMARVVARDLQFDPTLIGMTIRLYRRKRG